MAKILIAEDEQSVRELLSIALRRKGHDVQTVADGSEALMALSQERFDLLLTDIVMPVVDGIALSLKAARDDPDMRILMMTGYAAERQRAYNLEELIHDVVLKPFTMHDIGVAVEAALKGPAAA
ncbi:MAG: response regulator [Pseudomonadota bacterium]|jgi:two-component system, cell cycle response regulator CpdR|nr:response regulator [Alphaproteobacteria bacterium]